MLAIVSNAAINISGQVFEFLLSLFWGIYPEVELLDHVVILCLISFTF